MRDLLNSRGGLDLVLLLYVFVQLRIAKVKRIHSHGNTSTLSFYCSIRAFALSISARQILKAKEKIRSQRTSRIFPGGDKRDRTADLLNAIQALSQLSYTPIFTCRGLAFLSLALALDYNTTGFWKMQPLFSNFLNFFLSFSRTKSPGLDSQWNRQPAENLRLGD